MSYSGGRTRPSKSTGSIICEFLRTTLLDLADRAAGDVRREGYAGTTVALRIRDSRFRTSGKQRTLPAPTDSTEIIFETALGLLGELHEPGVELRLLGLSLAGLADAGQTWLDPGSPERARDEAVDRVRARFGSRALRRGCVPPAWRLGVQPESEGGSGDT